MTNTFDPDEFTATNMRIALNEVFSEATYGAIPVIDQYDALEAYLAIDDGALMRPLRCCPPFIRATATFPALYDCLMTFVARVLRPSFLTVKSCKHDPEG